MTDANELAALRAEQVRMDRELAVCGDRVERHDGEIKSLVRDVHEFRVIVTQMRADMTSGLSAIQTELHRLGGQLNQVIRSSTETTTTVATARGAYSTMMVVGGFVSGVASLVYMIGKSAGWWP